MKPVLKKSLKVLAALIALPPTLLLILSILLYVPAVQNWAVKQVAAYASDAMDMNVSVERVRLRFPLGLCKVDQQNACTSRIPAVTPILSMLTSRTEGPRSATKDWWYSSNPAKPTQMAPASRISQIPLTP